MVASALYGVFAVVQTEAESLPSLSNFRYRRPSGASDSLESIYMMSSSPADGGMTCAMDVMDCMVVVGR